MKTKSAKRIVIKVGTSVLADRKNKLDKSRIEEIVNQIAKLLNKRVDVLLVTSGAIGAGMGVLGIKTRPQSLPKLQACAAIGQSQLMKIYDDFFKKEGYMTAQLLLTRDDLADRTRYLNAKNTLQTLLEEGVVPIINENDTVSTDEIKFGDNDRLSSLVANLVKADLLIMLSDVDGLHRCDSKGGMTKSLMREVRDITDEIKKMALKTNSDLGTGGMASKIEAAKICVDSNIRCVIANGKKKDILLKIIDGERVGSTFLPKKSGITAKKHWIAHSSKKRGMIIVDDGAKTALVQKQKSLLSSGIIGVEDIFEAGDVVGIADKDKNEFARGVVNYSSSELKKIKGLKTNEIQGALGYRPCDEVVHRDNLAIVK